ncbi:MAG: DNA polymerase III subunit beta [Nitrospinota bacterium]|nr:DNA polymerase III subunit beta [Nitrospinota bacterium]
MEFKINQSEIERCLQRVQGFVNLKGANPVLSNVKISTKGKSGIKAFATDYDIGLSGTYEATVVKEGEVTLHAKRLFEIVRQLPNEEVIFRFSGTGRCEVECGKSNFKLVTTDVSEFPEEPTFPKEQTVKVDLQMLKDMMDKTLYAASQNESRMALNGIYCQLFPSSIKVVATDGHRLSFVTRAVSLGIKEKISMILPRKGVVELKKLFDEMEDEASLTIARVDNRIFFKIDKLEFFTREVEGTYPNYEQVIPQKNTKKATINVENVKKSIKRVSTVSADKSYLIHFHFKKGKLEISSEVSEVGEAHEEVDVEFSAEPLKLGLNSQYILETLSHITSESAELKLEGSEDAALIKPTDDDDYVSIIMPMRI